MSEIHLRSAGPEDADTLAGLVAELAETEGKSDPPASALQIAEWLGADDPPFEALLAEAADGRPLGYLAFYRAFSLFKPGRVLLVENVYVRPEARGSGVGRSLIAAAARTAMTRGWTRLELNVGRHNAAADAAYAALGFGAPGEEVRRVDDGALTALAGRAQFG